MSVWEVMDKLVSQRPRRPTSCAHQGTGCSSLRNDRPSASACVPADAAADSLQRSARGLVFSLGHPRAHPPGFRVKQPGRCLCFWLTLLDWAACF